MEVKRYTFSPVAVVTNEGPGKYSMKAEVGILESPQGDYGEYVTWADYAAVKQELDDMCEEVEKLLSQRDELQAKADFAARELRSVLFMLERKEGKRG